MSWNDPSWKTAAREYHNIRIKAQQYYGSSHGVHVFPANAGNSNGKGKAGLAIKLTFFDECSTAAPKRWLIKGVVAIGETSSWIAPPGKGKSALQTDISVNIAAGMDWRGYRSKGPHGVVYFAFERGDLVKRRLTAYARRRNLKALPIAVASQIIDLMHPGCVEIILATILAAEQRFGIRVGYIVIDTFAKGIAAGGGDEDKARDQNKCLTNLRRLHERAELHVAIVGHTGKDETRGSRGSNAHPADVDVQVQISGDEIKFARVIKGNDQPEGELTSFKLASAELGVDEDGDTINTAILSDEEIKTAPKSASWPRSLTQLFDAITTATVDDGFDHQMAGAGPTVRAVHLDKVRGVYKRNYVIAPDSKNRDAAVDKAMGRALKQARDCRLICGEHLLGRQIIWPVKRDYS
jgi:hypothetical protein